MRVSRVSLSRSFVDEICHWLAWNFDLQLSVATLDCQSGHYRFAFAHLYCFLESHNV